MPVLLIDIPDNPDISRSITLQDTVFVFVFQFVKSISRWKLDIYKDEELLIAGLCLVENVPITFKNVIPYLRGELILFRYNSTTLPAGRDNVGLDKDYILTYIYEG